MAIEANKLSKQSLQKAIQQGSQKFEEYFLWLEEHMPANFLEEIDEENLFLVTYSLMGFPLQEYFSQIHLKNSAIVLCLDTPDADLKILRQYQRYGIKNYHAFVSKAPLPLPEVTAPLRVAILSFTQFEEKASSIEEFLPPPQKEELFALVKVRDPHLTESEFSELLSSMSPRFLRALDSPSRALALEMFFRAKTRDHCQYAVRYHQDWREKNNLPSMHVVFAWRSVPKQNFLYHLAKTIYRHKLTLKKVDATYIDPYSSQSILVMSLHLHGSEGKAAWEEADVSDFLKEVVTLKYFKGILEDIETLFVDTALLRGNLGNLVKTMTYFVHQVLVHADPNMYSLEKIEEGLSRHPELTVQICKAFEAKFHPTAHNLEEYEKTRDKLLDLVEKLDTGNEINDTRRKNILRQAMHFVDFTLKTNFYRNNKTALSFRLDPRYLDHVPYDRKEKFPELPYAIFFTKGLDFIGFHIRFKELARGGVRTVFPAKKEQMLADRNGVFAECYNLAYTQQKKNKDIPEGGAKCVIFLDPFERMLSEEMIFKKELELASIPAEEIEKKLETFRKEQKLVTLYQSQRSYIESLVTLLNCEPDGTLKAKHIVDYWKRPEYIYLGPDENMHNSMIEWICSYSQYYGYKPGRSFMSSKPGAGINHKEYGVTSLGINVYMEEILKYMGIDPAQKPFTIKMTGGPDGDVAGNQILNLHRLYPHTAKLLALTDGSGTIHDPQGLNLKILVDLFHAAKPIRFYPPAELSEGGFLLDNTTKKEQGLYAQQTLCWRKVKGKLVEEWLSGNEMNHLLRHNIHQTKADIFITGGGRPRTLNENNYTDFLDSQGKPTSQAIVEGANLYLTPGARKQLEKLGVLIIKDSSANKGGVICSSFEVLASLVLSEKEFLEKKTLLMQEITGMIKARAKDEVQLLLRTFSAKKTPLTESSDLVSERINTYTYQLLDHLLGIALPQNPEDPLTRCLLNYCLPCLRENYQKRILSDHIPDIHKKAIIACYIASRVVYHRGLDWSPTIVDVLSLIASDPAIVGT